MQNKGKLLIIEPILSGHVLEWLNHYSWYIVASRKKALFVLPYTFCRIKDNLNWPNYDGIDFEYLSERQIKRCTSGNLLMCAYQYSKLIAKYVIKFEISYVYLTFLMKTIPFLPFFLPKGVKAYGVIYRLYLYDKEKTLFRIYLEKIRYLIISKSSNIKKAFVLNDEVGVKNLNQIYKTDKFVYLPDPLPLFNPSKFCDIRKKYRIPSSNKVYLQFGGLDKRKNIIPILQSILLMSDKELSDKTFVFAGKLFDSIIDEFENLINKVKEKVQIIVRTDFISYEDLNNYCYSCDYIFTIYSNTNQSSGAIGYAAYFKKPVIGVSDGLLGRLIKEYNLGYTLDTITPQTIKQAILSCPSYIIDDEYVNSHSRDEFCKILFNNL